MPTMLLMLLVFFAVSIGLIGVCAFWKGIWRRDQLRFCARVDSEFRQTKPDRNGSSAMFKSLDVIAREVDNFTGKRLGFRQTLVRILMQAGLSFSLRALFLNSAFLALVLGAAIGVWRQSVLVGLIAAVCSTLVPIGFVWLKWRTRMEALRQQLPDAFDAMGRSLRAGQTLEQAFQSIAQEFRPPLGPEFSYCFEQQNLGLPRETAYRDLAHRAGLMEIQIMVVAILVQQQSGGNLAELMDKLAVVVRGRFRMRDKIGTLTAESKFQALLLMALAPLMFVVLLIVKKSYMMELLTHPWLLAGVVGMQVVGAIWIHKICSFRY